MNRLLMPLMLVGAIALPIWHVLSPKPWDPPSETQPTSALTSQLPTTQYTQSPISVYSQASYSNPASETIYDRSSLNGSIGNGLSLPNSGAGFALQNYPSTGTRAQIVSKDVFQKLNGRTIVYSGDAQGPDLSGPPMEFIPTINLDEIFRFDASPSWVQQRWQRVSTCPNLDGLRGLRVALVTGTNPNDLHGSLTYFFDVNQTVQRISFQGWTGDSTKLLQFLTQKFAFEAQKTGLAGLYVSKKRSTTSGGLVMKSPVVIRADNPVQQVAMALEISNPKGNSGLSQYFLSVIAEASNP